MQSNEIKGKKVGKGLKAAGKRLLPRAMGSLRGKLTCERLSIRGKRWERLTQHPWCVELCFGMLDEQVGQWG